MAERTPLLDTRPPPYDVYNRFTTTQKRLIICLVSMVELMDRVSGTSFIPCVPQIAKDLNVTGVAVNYTIGAYMLVCSVGTLVWAPYAGFYGRRPVYLASLPFVFIGGLLCFRAPSLFELVIGRIMQAFGTSCVLAAGSATISDIYELEKRGTAMGIYLGTGLLGPLLGPVLGGWLTTYVSWRVVLLGMGIIALIVFTMVALFLPETSHPGTKGIEKHRIAESFGENPLVRVDGGWRFVSLNPFRILLLCRSPIIVIVSLVSSLALMAYYVVLVPLSYTIGTRYGIDSSALIGACFLPSGIGNIVGAVVSGRLADMVIIRRRKLRQGKWIPEDRLLAALPGALFFIPCALITLALSVSFIPGQAGLIISLSCLFFTAVGMEMVLAPCATYLVDLFRSQGVEVMSICVAMKQARGAIGSSLALPMVHQVGIITTNTTTAVLVWLGGILLYITIQNGEQMRAWIDMDYTIQDVRE